MFETVVAILMLIIVVAMFIVVTSRFEFRDPEEDEHAQGLEPWWLRGKK